MTNQTLGFLCCNITEQQNCRKIKFDLPFFTKFRHSNRQTFLENNVFVLAKMIDKALYNWLWVSCILSLKHVNNTFKKWEQRRSRQSDVYRTQSPTQFSKKTAFKHRKITLIKYDKQDQQGKANSMNATPHVPATRTNGKEPRRTKTSKIKSIGERFIRIVPLVYLKRLKMYAWRDTLWRRKYGRINVHYTVRIHLRYGTEENGLWKGSTEETKPMHHNVAIKVIFFEWSARLRSVCLPVKFTRKN
jgi:hypothetical protein